MSDGPLLSVEDVSAGYGAAQVLHGVSFEVREGEVVSLLGRNGMGKTTTVRALFGQVPWTRGIVRLAGQRLSGAPAYRVARAGVGLVPEGRQVFPNLTVRENLLATAVPGGSGSWTLESVSGLLPQLAARFNVMGARLSGGEQQMVAIGRALMTNPRLLILDEATEGLAPALRAAVYECLASLRGRGQSILLIDKHVAALERLADRHVILEKGRVAWQGPDLAAEPEIAERLLGV